MTDTSFADDLLTGAEEISLFINGSATPEEIRGVYYAIEKGYIPVRRKGRIVTSTKTAIKKAFTPKIGEAAGSA